jgi:DNA mismatch repair protein MutS2
MIHALLFKQKDKLVVTKQQKKLDAKYEELEGDVKEGDKVKMKNSRQVGVVKELRGKKAIVQIGMIPITVNKNDLVLVKEKVQNA